MSALRFQRLEIDRLAGIPRGSGFALEDLSADIILIHGPNGVGKTLVGHSLLALLWPKATTLERPTVAGRWTLNNDTWSVELDAGHPTWRCDGVTCDPPALPPAESRAHHQLGLRELLADDGPDAAATTSFAERIARELRGGFDLDAAARLLGTTDRPPQPRGTRREFDDARHNLDEASARERELYARSRTLEDLRTQRESKRQADERRRRLDRALEHRDAADEVMRLEGELSVFDDMLERLTGTEQDQLDELRERLRDAERDRAVAEQELGAAELDKAHAGFMDGVASREVLEAAGQDVKLISECQREVRQTSADLAEATSELERRAQRVATSVSTDALEAVGVTPTEEMARYAHDVVAHRTQAARVEARERELADGEQRLEAEAESARVGSEDQVRRGLEVLSRWLGSPAQPFVPKSGWLVPLLIAAGAILLLLLALAVLHHWGWVLGLIAVAVLVWLARPQPVSARGPDDRATYQREFESLELQTPEAWTTDAVRSMWFGLAEAWKALEGHKSVSQRLDAERADVGELRREFDAAEERLQRARSALEATLGFAIEDERSDWLPALGRHLEAWQSAKVRIDSLSARLNEQQSALETAIAGFNNRLRPYVDRPAEDPNGAGGVLERLEERVREYREATIRAQNAERNRQRAQSEVEQLAERIDALLTNLGLDENSESALSRWLDQLERYRAIDRQLGEARVRRNSIAADVGAGHPALEHDRARLESDRDAAQREAESLSALEQEIGAIGREIEIAKAGHHVEDARRSMDEAQASLSRSLRDAEQKATGHAVLEWLREEVTDRTQPAVLRHAGALFRRITHGRYELRVEESAGRPAFVAWDTQHEIQKSLNELSAGERVQLLVSVRLGFVEQEEWSVRLPLIFDEILGTTDDDRARTIIDTVVEVCRAGRQVFYFTAQPDEVGKWLGRLEGVHDVELKVIDLARVRGLAEAEGAPLTIDRPDEAPLPDPAGCTHEAYGRALGVAGLDPRQPVGMVHLWHLVDEPMLLHALVRKNIRCWGPFESLLPKGYVRVDGLDANNVDVAMARACAIRAAFNAWHIGRGKPVDRSALEASHAVSPTFLDRLTELAASFEGDARRLIDALAGGQVPRWRSSSTDLLREYLQEHGYLDDERPLTQDEIVTRALEATAREHAGIDPGDLWLGRMVAALSMQSVRLEAEARA